MLDHGHQGVAFFVPGHFLDVFFGGLRWSMYCVVCDIEKERVLLVAVDKIDRFLGDSSGEVALFFDGFEATINRVIHV